MEQPTNIHMSPPPRPTHDQNHDVSRKHPLPSDNSPTRSLDHFNRQFKLPMYPPPSYAQARDNSLSFPDHSTTELAPIKSAANKDNFGSHGISGDNSNNHNHTLPSLSSITASTSSPAQQFTSPSQRPPEPVHPPPAPPPLTHWPSLNPLTAYYTPSHVNDPEPPLRMDVDTGIKSTSSTASPDRFPDGRASSVSLDDPDVRMAAEALGNLRAG